MLAKTISIVLTALSIIMLFSVLYPKYNNEVIQFTSPAVCEANSPVTDITPSYEGIPEPKNPDKLSMYARAYCLMDAGSGRILVSKNGSSPMPMASTTKIMTCILALENGAMDSVVNVSSYAASMPDVQLNIREGEQYYLGDLLYSLMLESHNDTAVAIAEHIGGSKEGFAQMMNEKAESLGCTSTHFVTPNGLDADEHYTTAEDLCLIASYAIKNPDFLSITATDSHSFSDLSGKRKYTVNNHDLFLKMYNGALGVKTGFTGKAGYCFVGAAQRNGVTLTSSVLASGWPPHKSYKWSDTKTIMDYGFANYQTYTVLSGVYTSVEGQNVPAFLKPLSVINNNKAGSTNKLLDISFTAECSLPLAKGDNVSLTLTVPESITAPVSEGEIVGNASLLVNGSAMYDFPVTAAENINSISLKDIVFMVCGQFLPDC